VVERFYRGDASRGTPGVGLGLSLAQAVAKLHGSVLEFSDQAPGLRVAFTVPLDAAAAAPATPPAPQSVEHEVAAPATLASS
jgi:signal transduction histidine kinase